MLALGASSLIGLDAIAYSLLRYRLGHPGLPAGLAAVFLTPLEWASVLLLLPLVGLFVGLVLLATRALPFSSPVGVAAATLAAAALFNPLRRRTQRFVDRRFNRARYDSEATVAGFAARLRDAIDPDTIRNELLDATGRTLELTHASVWIRNV